MEEGQHKNKVIQEDSNEEKELEDRIGVIAIAAGQGIIDIFADLGTDFVVEGGQSMNPSTKDLLGAVKEVNANKIIILPNNKNVISAAEQVMKVTDREVVVLPSRSIPQGLTAMMGFNSAGELDEVKNIMIEEMELVETAQVTYAVRNSTVDGLEIKEGDILGLINGGIQIVTKDKEDVVLQLLDKLIDNDDPLITIYFGKEVSNREAKDLKKRLDEEVGDLDIEFYEGEQPLYYYLISVE
jgi:dihydroxyacetone kinase-like predicted kinase